MEEEVQKYTVDDALIAMGSGKFQIYLLAYAGMGWIAEAMEMMLLSFVGPAVQAEWGLSPNKESMITSVVFAGMLIGSYSWGIVSDKYGRRNGFFITAIFTSTAGISSALAPNYATLIFFRFFVGLGLGGGPVLSSWLLEFIPAPRRGTWMSLFSAFWTVGTLLEASLAWIVMPSLGWRWLLAFSAVPSAVLLIFYQTAPESPRYLCRTGRTDEAVEILERIARLNQAELPPGILVSDHQVAKVFDLPSEDARLLSPNKGEIEIVDSLDSTSSPQKGTSVFTLLSPQLLRSTLLLWVVFIGNAFAYYGLVLLTTALSSSDNKCTPNHSPSESGKSVDVNYKNVFITSFAEFPGLLLSAAMVDNVGRKVSMASMFFLCCLFLLPLAFYQSGGLVTPLLFGARICITSTFNIIYIYAPEIYPTSVRTTGVGVASSMGRIGGMTCPLVAVSLIHGCHRTAAILLFEAIIFVSGVSVLLFPIETSGRDLSDEVSDMNQEVELT
ncbi:organic cation/carnitine transporter 7-like isoform X2 [Chenopodium quinoa]|nr:organic cation/carnitine transporter 7-like isoform X2 [Chenopodium quinoa]